ncbi:hypothetical protein Tsubulata_025982 [Turnera subulata]|uniref:Uncharacterized protein n=1 Tax=Turnera subulata TaxID=218843 RepID=A0A9Q0FT29_9ROSI|nr:hypothetical protein Tsubulata_025982 [Turnera subulata]
MASILRLGFGVLRRGACTPIHYSPTRPLFGNENGPNLMPMRFISKKGSAKDPKKVYVYRGFKRVGIPYLVGDKVSQAATLSVLDKINSIKDTLQDLEKKIGMAGSPMLKFIVVEDTWVYRRFTNERVRFLLRKLVFLYNQIKLGEARLRSYGKGLFGYGLSYFLLALVMGPVAALGAYIDLQMKRYDVAYYWELFINHMPRERLFTFLGVVVWGAKGFSALLGYAIKITRWMAEDTGSKGKQEAISEGGEEATAVTTGVKGKQEQEAGTEGGKTTGVKGKQEQEAGTEGGKTTGGTGKV